jgi:hypothetical protein
VFAKPLLPVFWGKLGMVDQKIEHLLFEAMQVNALLFGMCDFEVETPKGSGRGLGGDIPQKKPSFSALPRKKKKFERASALSIPLPSRSAVPFL